MRSEQEVLNNGVAEIAEKEAEAVIEDQEIINELAKSLNYITGTKYG